MEKKTEEIHVHVYLSCYNVNTCINCKFEQREILYVPCKALKQSITVLLFKNTSVLLNIVHNTNYTQNNHETKYYVPRSSSSNGW